jgi:hypothetical protein
VTAGRLRAAARGEALDRLVHPVPVLALAVLLVNDHILKPYHPGWLSGKLSDVAVLVLLPFLLLAIADLAALVTARLPAPGRTALVVCVTLSVVAFTAIEVVPIAGDAYRWGLGLTQWPIRALEPLVASRPLPGVLPVQLTSDLSDLLTLPFAAIVVLIVRR